MKLTGFFTGDKQIATDAGKTQQNIAKTDVVNRQIRSMVPGQTIQGEVVSKNGSEVQIRLSDDMVLSAKVDRNVNLEVGKNVTFEVKNNGKALVLSPLFTNVATDANVLKALDMASLPVNGTTVALTKQLMEAGLPIDRNTLQQVYREVNSYPEAQTSDIVNLHKLQMPVNESNVTQMASYRNLTHQLVTGMNDVLEGIPEMFSQMMESGNTEGAAKLYTQLVLMASEGLEGTVSSSNQMLADNSSLQQAVELLLKLPQTDATAEIVNGAIPGGEMQNGMAPEISNGEMPIGAPLSSEIIPDMTGEQASAEVQAREIDAETQLNPQGALPGEDILVANGTPDNSTADNSTADNSTVVNRMTQQLQNLMEQLSRGASVQDILAQLSQTVRSGGDKEILNPLLQLLKQQWTIAPEQVADADQVEGLYRKLDKQLKSLAQTMETAGQTETSAYRAVTNMTQNLDFLQQVNQLYTYVQLPLRLQNGEAHGDLYVYTNKKHLTAKDGQISALLHLDMEHLGPVDVYVSMHYEKVNTKFYLQDDDMLDFMMEHMDILTERLQKRGYQCSFEMQVREQGEEPKTAIQRLLEKENHMPLAEYAFDVRT